MLLLQHSVLFFCYGEARRPVALLRFHSIRVGRRRFGTASPSIPRKPWKTATCSASFPLALSPPNWRSKQKSRRRLKHFCLDPRRLPADQICFDLKCVTDWSRLQQWACPTFVSKDVSREQKLPRFPLFILYFFVLVLLPDRQCRLDQWEVHFSERGGSANVQTLLTVKGQFCFSLFLFIIKVQCLGFFFSYGMFSIRIRIWFLQNQSNYSCLVTLKAFSFFFLHIWSRRALSRDCQRLFSTAAQSGTLVTDTTLVLYHSPTGLKVEMLNTGPFVMVGSLFPDFFFFFIFPLRAIIVCVRLRIGGLSRHAEERGAE